MKKLEKTVLLDATALPKLEGRSVFVIEKEIALWFQERKKALGAIREAPHYFDSFSDAEESFFGRFPYDSRYYGLVPEKDKKTRKQWESDLLRARRIFAKALDFLERSRQKKDRRESVRFNRMSMWHYDPKTKSEQEFILTQKTKWAFLCRKVHERCRQIGISISVHDAYALIEKECERDPFHRDPIGNLKWMRDTVASANRWAKRKGISPLLSCSSECVMRLL